MLKSIFNRQKKLILILASIVIFYICLFRFILNKPFILCNDQWFQYNIFYKEWINLILEFIKTKSLPFYSWNTYLGTDFYSAMGYYCTGDIFLPLLLLFKNNIELGLGIESILCVFISGILLNELLYRCEVKNERNRIFVSLIYALGGMASLYYGNYMFHRFFAFLPLLFIGLYSYLDNKKVITFILATTILLLQNYYFMFPTLIFLLIYSISEEIKRKRQFKCILKDFFILLGCLLIGFMISAVITLPSIYYVIHNSRISESIDVGVFWPFKTYIGLLMSLISLNPVNTGFSYFQVEGDGHNNWYTLFIGILPLISCFYYISRKENKNELITLIFVLLILIIKPLSSMMHGFSIPSFRWIFVVELLILLYGARGLDLFEIDISTKTMAYIYIYIGLYILAFITLLIITNFNSDYLKHICILLISLVLACLILSIYKNNKYAAFMLSILEIICFQSYYFYLQTNGVVVLNEVFNKEEVEYNIWQDEDIFRYHFDSSNASPASVLNQNTSIVYNFMSLSTYNSMSDYNIETFNILSNSISDLDWILSVDDPYASTMLGCKYYIVYSSDELPNELNFEYAYNLNYLKVYKNLDYQGFGYSASKVKYINQIISSKDFIDYILIDDETIDISKYVDLNQTKLNIDIKYNNYFNANIDLNEDNIVLIPIPNNEGWTIKVNGEAVKPISVNGGFIGLELKSGHADIEMNFISPYFKEGFILSCLGILTLICLLALNKNKKIAML